MSSIARPALLLPLAVALAACTPPAPQANPAAPADTAVTAADTPAVAPAAAAAPSPSTPLPVGANAPDFSADAWLAGQPTAFKLSDALAKGPVVVYFFPAAYTPGCNIEAHLFSKAIDRFEAAGARVIGVTSGNADQLQKFSADNERCAGKFAVAADPGAKIAAQFGAVLDKKPEWSSRTSFLVGGDGRIVAVHADMRPEGHVDAMLAGLKPR